jgi:hypothetical protein
MWSNTQTAGIQTTEDKLAQLRTRTDRDLTVLLARVVERSFGALARNDYAEAEAGHAQAARLLPLTQEGSAHTSGAVRARLAELRAELDRAECSCAQ